MRALLRLSDPKKLLVTIELEASLEDFIALEKQIDNPELAMRNHWPMSGLYSAISDAVKQAEKSFYAFVSKPE